MAYAYFYYNFPGFTDKSGHTTESHYSTLARVYVNTNAYVPYSEVPDVLSECINTDFARVVGWETNDGFVSLDQFEQYLATHKVTRNVGFDTVYEISDKYFVTVNDDAIYGGDEHTYNFYPSSNEIFNTFSEQYKEDYGEIVKPGFSQVGWDIYYNTYEHGIVEKVLSTFDETSVIAKPETFLVPKFVEGEMFTVTFLNYDGTLYKKVRVLQGEEAKVEAPTRLGYKFIGWSENISDIQEDITATAMFKEEAEIVKDAFRNGVEKILILEFDDKAKTVLTNNDFKAESMQITQSLSEDSQLRFGKCNATEFQITVFKTDISYKNLSFTAKMLIPSEDVEYNLGKYYVFSDKYAADRGSKQIIAYDKLFTVNNTEMLDWYNTYFVSGRRTVKDFRDKFFEKVKIEQVDAVLPFDNIFINQKSLDAVSGQDIIEAICELNGCFGRLNFSGKFEYVFPDMNYGNVTDYQVTSEDYYKTTFEDYKTQKITALQIVQGQVGGMYGRNADNVYVIRNNILLDGKSENELTKIAKTLYGKIKDIQYIPFDLQMYCQPWLEVGDSVEVTTLSGETFKSTVLKRTISGIIGVKDKYSTKGSEYYTDKLTNTQKAQDQSQKAYDKAEETSKTVETFSGEIEDLKQNAWNVVSVAELPPDPDFRTIYFIQGTVG